MKTYFNPDKDQWSSLTQRPLINNEQLTQKVNAILEDVQQNGDEALRRYSRQFDDVELSNLLVTEKEIENSTARVPDNLKEAIQLAYHNISLFHQAQQIQENEIETSPGVKCWRRSVAIEKVGLYIPGGSAPLFSTILMLGIPARIAGCKEIVLCTPPDKNEEINPAILYAAKITGITRIYKVGGAQAIAAMAYGTETVPRVYKIFGPGNQYVTKAKEIIQQHGVAIDLPAGPSEVLVIADKTCEPDFVAADLLSQAEHGSDSQVMLLGNDKSILKQCLDAVYDQLEELPRKETAYKALQNSKAIFLNTIEECVEFSNAYAPEHLIIASENANYFENRITDAGSVFLGNYSCESAGDYASGTNHTLPTNGFAKSYSGVSLDSFFKKITFQQLSEQGISNIGKAIETMAEAEELAAHKNAVSIRLNKINDDQAK
jgi:histidinol dehydrogenase